MFLKCLINSAIISAHLRGKELIVAKRYLKVYYDVSVSLKVLKVREMYLKLKGRLKKANDTR
tara:strand:+ start:88 stop:273 length:186 start_codon:yes stop_codon:yes gene_type:complete